MHPELLFSDCWLKGTKLLERDWPDRNAKQIQILYTCSETWVWPELLISAAGQKDRGLQKQNCRLENVSSNKVGVVAVFVKNTLKVSALIT